VPRETGRQIARSYAADAVARSKAARASSSSNTSSWIVQGPKLQRRVVDERKTLSITWGLMLHEAGALPAFSTGKDGKGSMP
jgi:hypothetical protein